MREPQKIVAAIDIAAAMRGALANQFDRHKATGRDEDVLMIELGRMFGPFLRWQDARPSVVGRLVESVRSVHAGLKSQHTPDAAEAVRELCPESTAETANGDSEESNPTVQ